MFCSGLVLDADFKPDGWEIWLRYEDGYDSQVFTEVSDEALPGIVGPHIARLLIEERARASSEPGAAGNDEPDERHNYHA